LESLHGLELEPVDRCILDSHLRHLGCLDGEIGFLDSRIAGQALESEDALLLMTLTGVDYHSATLLALEIGDINPLPVAEVRLMDGAVLGPLLVGGQAGPWQDKEGLE
jgi:hypothetical protein